ncbi:PIR Superfamily Protein [Plasmodium ovale wallikeri]|uniref:PIR Superfamily Protein n=2 Tax=Plasmodium ovale TaxID=36330 RepID=A0A1A9AQW8_PLAOA|nr:PIR Superfamily Protein [Plasmodium ovale wallikeri]SBT59581.1 PIR Superfamily Protein [Plasmodium ovale wallikeri]SBT77357.1 PIR protein [Plasmodium ovale]
MDTTTLRREYPFLSDTWDMYDKYDETAEDDGYTEYSTKCGHIVLNYNQNISTYNDFCMKLLRNLYRIADVESDDEDRQLPCTYLNMWLYYKEKIHEIPKEFINQIFRIADELIKHLPYDSHCIYDESHKNHKEPYKIMLLNIFLDNIDAIEDIMKKDKDSNQESCLNFVKDCLSIYNEINKEYCLDDKDHTFKATCDEIKTFEEMYKSNLLNKSPLNEKMPPLTYSGMILPDRVTLEYQAKVSMTDADDSTVITGLDHASTIGGTVAGMGSFLLLIYKFTSFGNWIGSRIGRRKGMSDNLGGNEMDHMYLNGHGNDSMYSNDIGYNMGYNAL